MTRPKMMVKVPEMPIFQAWVTHQIKADRLVGTCNKFFRESLYSKAFNVIYFAFNSTYLFMFSSLALRLY